MLSRTIRRFASNFKNFQSLEELNKHLLHTKPVQSVIYFRASWNPQCEQSDQDALKLANSKPGVQVIRIDSDSAPKIAKHYSIRAEPEFVFCLYGDQVLRQIGVDYDKLEEKIEKMQKLAREVDLSDLDHKWVEYGTGYKAYYQRWVKEQYNSTVSDL